MKRLTVLVSAAALVASCLSPVVGGAAEDDLARYVDPFVGTLGGGFTFPGAASPYGMVQLSPDTDGYFAYTGYQWGDAFIRGFSHVHIESMGVHAGGDLPFMPTIGAVRSDPALFKSPFVHAAEQASPGYYKVLLAGSGTVAELTTGLRTGMHRYTFPQVPAANVILDIGHTAAGTDLGPAGVTYGVQKASLEIVDDTTVVGTEENGDDHYTVHFAAKFSRPFASFGGWNEAGGTPVAGAREAAGDGAGGYVTFDATKDRTVLIKVGISFVSRENALANLDDEIPGTAFPFDELHARTRAAWNDALHAIEVSGGTPFDLRTFYTALYHAQHHPNVFEDANGEYLGNDGKVHVANGFTYYTNFSLWDTYRTENQLLALIAPDRFRDMATSMLRIAQEGGRLPRWNLMNQYADFMNGEPAIPAIVDGFCRGVVAPADVEPLYEAMRTLALDPAHHRDPVYLEAGFIPYDLVNSGASSTLEHAIADFALALMAERLGKTADRDALLKLAANYRNVVDGQGTRFVRPRLSDWSWLTPYHPELPDGFREGTGWQYTWLVPQDVRGLVEMLGGDAVARQKLDTFFSAALAEHVPFVVPEIQRDLSLFGIAYVGNQYSPDNEHDLQAPFLYNYVGQPWKTQAIVRNLQSAYRPTPDGLPGNDDLGTMSAWYIWSALGFYPETAGAPLYVVASPVFTEAKIRLPGGTFTVTAPGASLLGKYVQSASLNGEPHDRSWFTHDAIAPGGSVEFRMGPAANRSWAAGPEAAPPSMSTDTLSRFGCAG
ncbi:MAG: GH92 family glycosyl hydrolase [Actinomycetota bacterium]